MFFGCWFRFVFGFLLFVLRGYLVCFVWVFFKYAGGGVDRGKQEIGSWVKDRKF